MSGAYHVDLHATAAEFSSAASFGLQAITHL
jgi:hypothetical protein